MSSPSNPYEFIRYSGYPYPKSHPDRHATAATMFGMQPQDLAHCRVLEIGCCDGGNLIPMAMAFPGSEFVGIDITESDITEATQAARDLGFGNIHFHLFDLTNLPGPFGQFDYIICHGLYSWIPEEVREKMLEVIQLSLLPQGVAYVSFNSMPGGHIRHMLREMTLFHLRDVVDPHQRLPKARQFLEFLKTSQEPSAHTMIINRQIELMLGQPDQGLFHDGLGTHYRCLYLHEFAAHAARYGLQYLSDASYFDTRPECLGSEVGPVFLSATAGFNDDALLIQQYLDFSACTYFQQTLICHSDIKLQRKVDTSRLKSLYFASPSAVDPKDPNETGPDAGIETFVGARSSRIAPRSPLVSSIMHAMIDVYPHSVPFDRMPGAQTEPENVCNILYALLNTAMIAAHKYSPVFTLTPGEHPLASPLARWQHARSRSLTNLRHTFITLDTDLQKALLPLLDGTRNRAQLLSDLSPHFAADVASAARTTQLNDALKEIAGLCLLQA
jgi:ubiquinone/menaquinone biosynthesis C-methylase UbiE/methyltransferase-like protein